MFDGWMTDFIFCTNAKEMTTLWEEGLKVSKDKFIHFATAVPTVESSTRGTTLLCSVKCCVQVMFLLMCTILLFEKVFEVVNSSAL